MDLSSTFSCSPIHLCTCLFLFPLLLGSSFRRTKIYSFFASLSLFWTSSYTLPQIQTCWVCCSLTQLDMDLWGPLLLPPSIHYYIIVIITENSTWLSYNFTLVSSHYSHPTHYFNLSFCALFRKRLNIYIILLGIIEQMRTFLVVTLPF